MGALRVNAGASWAPASSAVAWCLRPQNIAPPLLLVDFFPVETYLPLKGSGGQINACA